MSYYTDGWCKEGKSGSEDFDSQPNGVVSSTGLYHKPWMNMIGKRADDPPLILLHNTGDPYHNYEEQAKAIYDHAQSNGLPSTLITFEDEKHGDLN